MISSNHWNSQCFLKRIDNSWCHNYHSQFWLCSFVVKAILPLPVVLDIYCRALQLQTAHIHIQTIVNQQNHNWPLPYKFQKPMAGPSKNIKWWWSNGFKTFEEEKTIKVKWPKKNHFIAYFFTKLGLYLTKIKYVKTTNNFLLPKKLKIFSWKSVCLTNDLKLEEN